MQEYEFFVFFQRLSDGWAILFEAVARVHRLSERSLGIVVSETPISSPVGRIFRNPENCGIPLQRLKFVCIYAALCVGSPNRVAMVLIISCELSNVYDSDRDRGHDRDASSHFNV